MTKKSKTQVNNALIFHITTSVIRFLPACVKQTKQQQTNKNVSASVNKQHLKIVWNCWIYSMCPRSLSANSHPWFAIAAIWSVSDSFWEVEAVLDSVNLVTYNTLNERSPRIVMSKTIGTPNLASRIYFRIANQLYYDDFW